MINLTIAIILALILTFADQIEILYHPMALILIGVVLIGLVFLYDDYGLVILTSALFAIVFNMQTITRQSRHYATT